MNGIINVYKEAGMTSFQVVAAVRRITGIKKCGHTGTLDPMAEGVLPICVGYATRFAEMLTAEDKQYIAKYRLGESYDTYDITGTIKDKSDKVPSDQEVFLAFKSLEGEKELVVPAFSAKKIDGKRAYDLARSGEIADAGTAVMKIYKIKPEEYSYPDGGFIVDCGKGTYVRSIINQVGIILGTYAAMSGLVRSKSGMFSLETAYKLNEIQEMHKMCDYSYLLPVENCVKLKHAILKPDINHRIRNGIAPMRRDYSVFPDMVNGEECFIFSYEKELLALGLYENEKIILTKVLIK